METPRPDREEELLQLVTFPLGDEEFGVRILAVREIDRMLEIPGCPARRASWRV